MSTGVMMARQFDGIILYTPEEVAERLGVGTQTVRVYLKDGRLRGRKFAGHWYIPADALVEYFSQPEPPDSDDSEA